MVAGSITEEVAAAVPAELMFKAAFGETRSELLPKACPGFIDAVEIDGDGGPGSIITMKLNPAVGGDVRSRVVAFDAAARVLKTEVLEFGAGAASAGLKSHVSEVKVEAAGEGACVARVKVDYERHDGEGPLPPEVEAKLAQAYVNLVKMVEAYLAAHPDVSV